MLQFRSIVTQDVYPDAPGFSDEVLLPAIKSGNSVTMLTAFTPSYLVRLVRELSKYPKRSDGVLRLVFCVPVLTGSGLSKARLFSKYFSAYADSAEEVKSFLKDLKSLSLEGKIHLSALVSSTSQMLTPSCLGLIESNDHGSEDLISFVDLLADDSNSPITISQSWTSESEEFKTVKSSISKALFHNFPNMHRLAATEIIEILTEILTKGYPKQDVLGADGSKDEDTKNTKRKKKEEKTVKKTVKPASKKSKKRFELLDDGLDDDEEDYFEDELFEDDEIDRIIDEVSFRDLDYYAETLDEFLDISFLNENQFDDVNRVHAGPMSENLAELFGHPMGVCWCGQEYDTSIGCPEYLY